MGSGKVNNNGRGHVFPAGTGILRVRPLTLATERKTPRRTCAAFRCLGLNPKV
ncbi:hypothetical protein Z947_2338 [Sulfitobacter geojensis]|nr:hypothetical protein Z947_2338 [Sulfitobacter geojensis]